MKLCVKLKCLCLFILIISIAGCSKPDNMEESLIGGFIPALFVTGDVENALRIDAGSISELSWGEIDKDGEILPCVNLQELVLKSNPYPADYDLLLAGSDGLSSRISGNDLTGCYVAFSDEFSWECINENHPISSRIKMLQKIVIVAENPQNEPEAVGFLDDENDTLITPGSMILNPLLSKIDFEGTSEINGNTVTVYTPHTGVLLSDFMDTEDELCAVGKDGKIEYFRGNDDIFIEVSGNRIDLIFTGGNKITDLAGVMKNPPKTGIWEVYSDSLYFLEKGQSVMVIELDGWGYEMSQLADRGGYQAFMSGIEKFPAIAEYPTISPTGLAGMITGTTPDNHGIHSRSDREPLEEDIFKAVEGLGKSSAYIEGETSLISTYIDPVLSPDTGGIPGTDDEVFNNAVKALQDNPDFIFIHFHGIDDIATAYGPYSHETMEKIKEVDGYVESLVNMFDGKVIITSDHGLHETGEGGSHGSFLREDLIVPYCIFDGGNYNGQ